MSRQGSVYILCTKSVLITFCIIFVEFLMWLLDGLLFQIGNVLKKDKMYINHIRRFWDQIIFNV